MATYKRNFIKTQLLLFDSDLTTEQANALTWVGLKNYEDPKKATIAYQQLTQQQRDDIEIELGVISTLFPKNCP
jgi:hypothetical protein